ncbi:MAG: outer membrane protein assembly factor BamD [Parachlamydiales bacterium]|nr:outer membrane protein assembly factor BamD [Parachlamydiales bacterium]
MFNKLSYRFALAIIAATSVLSTPCYAVIGPQNDLKMSKRFQATATVQEHYQAGIDAVEACRWDEVVMQFQVVITSFPDSKYALESLYYLGIGYFYTGDYDFANQNLSLYLQMQTHPKHFYETMQYKYAIAEQFGMGARCHLFGLHALPKWMDSTELAITIYDEIIAALPNDELAAKSMYAKARLHYQMKEYTESIDNYQNFIRRFPKNELAPDAYLGIAQAYYCESLSQANNPDIQGLAQINLKRFRLDFPGDERIALAEEQLASMQETGAQVYLEMGYYYERIKHPEASILYYMTAIQQFPNTQSAINAQNRIDLLKQKCPHLFAVAQ